MKHIGWMNVPQKSCVQSQASCHNPHVHCCKATQSGNAQGSAIHSSPKDNAWDSREPVISLSLIKQSWRILGFPVIDAMLISSKKNHHHHALSPKFQQKRTEARPTLRAGSLGPGLLYPSTCPPPSSFLPLTPPTPTQPLPACCRFFRPTAAPMILSSSSSEAPARRWSRSDTSEFPKRQTYGG